MSMLSEIKILSGIQISNTGFDQELLLHMNSAASDLVQLGVDEFADFQIVDNTTEWPTFPNTVIEALVKQVMYLKVRILWDPIASETIMTVFQNAIASKEGRIAHEIEEVNNVV